MSLGHDTWGNQPGWPGTEKFLQMQDFQPKRGKFQLNGDELVTLCDNNIRENLWCPTVDTSSETCFQVSGNHGLLVVEGRDLNDH